METKTSKVKLCLPVLGGDVVWHEQALTWYFVISASSDELPAMEFCSLFCAAELFKSSGYFDVGKILKLNSKVLMC